MLRPDWGAAWRPFGYRLLAVPRDRGVRWAATPFCPGCRRACNMNPDHLKRVKIDAEKGNKEAQRYLGFLYCLGDSVPKDHVEAYKWLTLCEHETARVVAQQIAKRMTADEMVKARKLILAFKTQ